MILQKINIVFYHGMKKTLPSRKICNFLNTFIQKNSKYEKGT